MALETWELLSYIVTVVGLPMAIFVFLYEKRKETPARRAGGAGPEGWNE